MNWTLIIVILFIIAIILVAAVLIMALARTQERNRRKAFAIEISNLGNANSRYEVWADDPGHVMKFVFMLNGVPMGQAPQPVGQNLLATPATRTTPRPQNTYTQNAAKPGVIGTIANVIAELADTLGHFIPGSAGYSILQVSERIRMGQSAVTRTQRTAQSVGKYGPKTSNPSSQPGYSAGSMTSSGNTSSAAVLSATGGGTPTRPQTPVLEPGKQLKLDLIVRPVMRLKTSSVSFAILSRSLDQPEAESLSEAGAAVFPSMTGIGFYLPYIVIGAAALIMIIIIVAVTNVLG
jgi:hypothetical protein